jgi:catechol-2,3-dioxygenase
MDFDNLDLIVRDVSSAAAFFRDALGIESRAYWTSDTPNWSRGR